MTNSGRPGDHLVSVLIAVRDGERFLAAAIESVLVQTYRPLELVVVDDGSRDGSAEIAERFGAPVTVLRQAALGLGAARNRAVEISAGDLLAFLDADDLFVSGRLERQVAALDADRSLEAVVGRIDEFLDPGVADAARAELRRPREGATAHLLTAMLIRRSAFERVGPFLPDQPIGVNIEWSARALDAGVRSVEIDAVVLLRRLHGGNIGVTRWDERQRLVEIVRERLARKRSAEGGPAHGGAV